MNNMEEPLLTENRSRHVIFPIQYNDVWSMYKKHVSTYWTVEEIDFMKDIDSFKIIFKSTGIKTKVNSLSFS